MDDAAAAPADDPRIEEQQVYRAKVGRWRAQTAEAVRDRVWWFVLQLWFPETVVGFGPGRKHIGASVCSNSGFVGCVVSSCDLDRLLDVMCPRATAPHPIPSGFRGRILCNTSIVSCARKLRRSMGQATRHELCSSRLWVCAVPRVPSDHESTPRSSWRFRATPHPILQLSPTFVSISNNI
jgi:hypothetical protein